MDWAATPPKGLARKGVDAVITHHSRASKRLQSTQIALFTSAHIGQNGRAQLISRNGNPFNFFAALCKGLTLPLAGKTVIDGEIVGLDKRGRPQFRDLLFHRGEPCFFAFDLLMADGKDLRSERLTDRKQELRRLMLRVPESRMRYVDHVEQHGTALFQRVCKMDLEGIVAKHAFGPYVTEP